MLTSSEAVVVVTREWLESDGLGGFASGPVAGPRTRRYHALLLAAAGPRRFVLVNGFDAEVTTAAGTWPLTVQSFEGARAPSNQGPHAAQFPGDSLLESFIPEPWPTWTFRLPDGTRLVHELLTVHGEATTLLSWRLLEARAPAVHLRVRPFLSGRDYHALHHENPGFAFAPVRDGATLIFRPYPGVPEIHLRTNGAFQQNPLWYRAFHYADEAARGLDATEDLAAPGVVTFALRDGEAHLLLGTAPPRAFEELRSREASRRRAFASPLHRAAAAYVVARPGGGRTILAGYPWFTDWGRDTFIALRGLCLATGALDDARAILLRWAALVSRGMLPNRFPDDDSEPEYNAADAALWYAVAAYELLRAPGARVTGGEKDQLRVALESILLGHVEGTRYGIRATSDGLLAAGQPGVQLTWMDAKIPEGGGDWVVTPRIGKPVELQALWLNALRVGAELGLPSAARWRSLFDRGLASFRARFWDPTRRQLHDVVDDEHVPGRNDATLRPNQIFAVGGLPWSLLDGEEARAVVDTVERELLTPLGLRSLGPDEPGYRPRYDGDMRSRDSAYHQGTVWPWLLGPFVEAWVRVRGETAAAKAEAERRFVEPLRAHLGEAGVGHISEVADAEPPHTPGGCPFQAWSLGELLRLTYVVLAEEPELRPSAALANDVGSAP